MNRIILFLAAITLGIASCTCGGHYESGYQPIYVYPGIGLGTIIAVVVSWSRNHSILWAIIHGFLGWLYVIYAILVKNEK